MTRTRDDELSLQLRQRHVTIQRRIASLREIGDDRGDEPTKAATAIPHLSARSDRSASGARSRMLLFLGSRADHARLLAAADLVLHTGSDEGIPLVLIQALAEGRPVVAMRAAARRRSWKIALAVCSPAPEIMPPWPRTSAAWERARSYASSSGPGAAGASMRCFRERARRTFTSRCIAACSR